MKVWPLAARIINAPAFLWLLLSLPAVYWCLAYRREVIYYGEFIHLSGDFAVQLLILTLAISLLRILFPKTKLVRWLMHRRRYFGVAVFGYGMLHTLVYLQRKADWNRIVDEAQDIGLWTGWLALFVMLLLAVTSNNYSVRRLKRRWQLLHRAVYIGAALIFAHWIITAFDATMAYIHLVVLSILLLLRLALQMRRSVN